jgi:pheromone shutdown protein TraB
MKFEFKDTQKRVEEIIALKGDHAAFVIAGLIEAAYLRLEPGDVEKVKDYAARGYSGQRISDMLHIPIGKVYQIIRYERQ